MSFNLRIFREKKIGDEEQEKDRRKIVVSIFSAERIVVQNNYHRRDAKFIRHSTERRRM